MVVVVLLSLFNTYSTQNSGSSNPPAAYFVLGKRLPNRELAVLCDSDLLELIE